MRANFLDRMFVFHPSPWIDRDWAGVSRLPLEEVRFRSADGVNLFGWYVESREHLGVLLWCHGNAGNIIHRLENCAQLYRAGLSVFLFDYRGYGRSEGMPSEEGLYQDAFAAYGYLARTRGIRSDHLVLFGRSLGAAVAGTVASQRPAAGLILESPFPSVESVAKATFGVPAHWLLQSRFRLIDRLRDIRVAILVIHGDRDDIIPIGLGRQVFDAAPSPKSFYVVQGADHNNTHIVGGKPYLLRFRSFVEEVVR
ncbi:MAG: alpha/beta hydrolase [Nitrospiraceae bacterium]